MISSHPSDLMCFEANYSEKKESRLNFFFQSDGFPNQKSHCILLKKGKIHENMISCTILYCIPF